MCRANGSYGLDQQEVPKSVTARVIAVDSRLTPVIWVASSCPGKPRAHKLEVVGKQGRQASMSWEVGGNSENPDMQAHYGNVLEVPGAFDKVQNRYGGGTRLACTRGFLAASRRCTCRQKSQPIAEFVRHAT